jgi:ribosome biogenesis GTPase / thiamine phosphate phosphatase
MIRKFRGGSTKGVSEEWLDSDESSRLLRSTAKKKKKANQAKAVPIPAEESNGTVVEVYPKQCLVLLDDGRELMCQYRRASVFGWSGNETRERSPVAVGDRVKAQPVGQKDGVVEGVAARRTKLVRPAPDRDREVIQVIAANIDILAIVTSVRNPEFSTGLVDRFLVAAIAEGITPILCLNKIDLIQKDESRPWEFYQTLGVEVIEESAKFGQGVSVLHERFRGKTVVFCGHSGVGKTSLLRALLGTDFGCVGEVSQVTGKGKHTTTGAIMLIEPGSKSQWIDTPGVREFGLQGVEPGMLQRYFPEFANLDCTRLGCLHVEELDCQARDLVRYSSYRRIFQSLIEGGR